MSKGKDKRTIDDPLTPRPEGADARLARLHGWCVTGRQAAAELELMEWRRAGDAPAAALALLASLQLVRGDAPEARRLLGDGGRDAATGCLALTTMVLAGDEAAATLTRDALVHRFGEVPAVRRAVGLLDVPAGGKTPAWPTSAVDALAAALDARRELIPSLVFVQTQRPRTATLALLRSALVALVRRHEGQSAWELTLCRALAELAMVLGDEHDARRWAQRGLAIDPYQASLALVLSWTSGDEAEAADSAHALRRVAGRHPDYPDVAAALRRCEDRAAAPRRAA